MIYRMYTLWLSLVLLDDQGHYPILVYTCGIHNPSPGDMFAGGWVNLNQPIKSQAVQEDIKEING